LLTAGRRKKAKRFAESTLDSIVVLPFNAALAALDAEQFVDEILLEKLGMG